MKLRKEMLIALFIAANILWVVGAVFGFLFVFRIFGEDFSTWAIPFFVVGTVIFIFALTIIWNLQKKKKELKELKQENRYILGEDTGFFDMVRFNIAAQFTRGRVINKNKPHSVVCFSFAPLSISSNPDHNSDISRINYEISQFVDSYFQSERRNRKGKYGRTSYCFNRGYFLIYLLAGEADAQALCEYFSKRIYEICGEIKTKILIQPFFGIAPTSAEENLTGAIENAVISRSHGEEMFEMYTTYDPSFKVQSSHGEIEEIQKALENEEFVVFYQPKYSLKEKKFISCEALVRWNSPTRGFLSPTSFIERAEHAGLISEIDLYVFRKTLQDIAEMRARGHRVIPVSVNFSLYEFFSPNFLDTFMGLLNHYKVPPTLIEVEITETTSQANQFMSIQIIKRLKDNGIRVLMDDFGIGYSGIDNLRKIPFDAIKIDKSFTDLLVEDEKTRSIIKLIIDLGHLNDIEVIIEGVDNQQQVDILRRQRIDTIQGFYYSRPVPLNEFEAFLRDNPFEKGAKK